MAKGNLFQGMARGKVGDVVFSRLNGEQITRVRNRNPRNPKTNRQLVQRAIMATVMQAYSKGKMIFDHAFEGYSVGSGCQRRFMELNALTLRGTVANDINAGEGLADQLGRVVAPKTTNPVPNTYIVSEGTYENVAMDNDLILPAPVADEKVGAYCARVGLLAGDYYTVIVFGVKSSDDPIFQVGAYSAAQAKQFPCTFGFARLKVKDSAIISEDAITANTTMATLFEVDESLEIENAFMMKKIGDAVDFDEFFGEEAFGAYGVIRSRKDRDLRSNCTLKNTATTPFGIASSLAVEAWKQGAVEVGDSDLILEGGNF